MNRIIEEKGVDVFSLNAFTEECGPGGCRPIMNVFLIARTGGGKLCVIELVSIQTMEQAMAFRKDHPDKPDYLSSLSEVECLFFNRPIPADALPDDFYDPNGVMRKNRL